MVETLEEIFELEDNKEFEMAFEAYNNLYSKSKLKYEIWKHFYFFLWTAIEDAPSSFQNNFDLDNLLHILFEEGKKNFKDIADFNFIAGYTVSIFPYEYGNYEEMSREANQMLLKATQLEPENRIYQLAYIGNTELANPSESEHIRIEAVS